MNLLDDAYANAPYIEGAEAWPPRWAAQAAEFRAALGSRAETGLRYGDSPRQVFDFFNTTRAPAGTLIFVHGGYWKAFDHTSWSHFAAGALSRDWAVAMPGYDLCPDVRISDITRQIATAIGEIAARTTGPLALAGHSAGGHLVARMTDPSVLPAPVRDRIRRVVPISPLSDLTPLMQTSMNEILRIDAEEAETESPVRQPSPDTDVRIRVGGAERPAFLEQAAALASAWGAEQDVIAGLHHFDIIDALADQDSDLVRYLTAG